jgi:signal transduction histidine kinase
MIKIRSAKQRNRLLRLLLAAVVIPGVIISIIGAAAVSRQKRAREIKLEEEYRRELFQAGKEIENGIERAVRNTFLEVSLKKIEFANPSSVQKALKETLLKNPIVKYPFIINSKSKYIFPFSRKIHPVFYKMPKTILYQGTAGENFREGENMEFKERRFVAALKYYLKALSHTRNRNISPYIYNSIARCYYKLNKFPQTASYLADLRNNFPEQLKKNKPLYFSVLYQAALSYKAMAAREKTAENFLQLYDEILQYEMSGDVDNFAFFKNEALEYLNRHIKEIDREKQKLYRAEVLDRLQSFSGIDISLSWRFFDMEIPANEIEEEGISSDASKFKKIREFYVEDNEKNRFYRQVKKLPEWKRDGIPYFELKKIGDEYIAFDKLNSLNQRKSSLFFGFLISSDYIRDHIFASVVKTQLNKPDVRLLILDKGISLRGGAPGWELMSIPFGKYMTGKKLFFVTPQKDYLQTIIKRELLLNYILIFALILALVFGIFFFYKYITREAELVRIKSGFVDSASHTLKTPLTRIRMLAEKMELGWVENETKKQEYYQSIVSETDRMTEMIDNMLDFSKIEAGKKIYEPRQANIREVVAPIITRFATHLKGLGFRFEVDIAKDIPEFCFDPEAIHLIIVNLLQNAVKYSIQEKYTGIRIYEDADRQRVAIEVADKGIGLEHKEKEKIFAKFYRVGNEKVKALEGSGLGLFLVNHAVKAHDGEIEVKSEPGAGAAFTIFLPCPRRERP